MANCSEKRPLREYRKRDSRKEIRTQYDRLPKKAQTMLMKM